MIRRVAPLPPAEPRADLLALADEKDALAAQHRDTARRLPRSAKVFLGAADALSRYADELRARVGVESARAARRAA